MFLGECEQLCTPLPMVEDHRAEDVGHFILIVRLMHRREQCGRQMGRRRCGAYEVEEFVISGNRQRDARVER